MDALLQWCSKLVEPVAGGTLGLSAVAGDASFRRYFRVAGRDHETVIAMDAPPGKEDVEPYLKVARMLADIGVHAENLARYVTGLEIEELCADITSAMAGHGLEDDANVLVHERATLEGPSAIVAAAGLPAIASPVGINADIVRHGENGFLARTDAEWHDNLLMLARDHELRRCIGLAARKTIEDAYSLDGYLERYCNLIESCLP